MGAALGFAGRALAKRMKKAYDEKIAPAMEARAAQAQQQSQQRWQQSQADQDAIVQRYPELRGCLADQVDLPRRRLQDRSGQRTDAAGHAGAGGRGGGAAAVARPRYLRAAIAQRMAPMMAWPAGGTITGSATGRRGSRSSRRAHGGSSAIAVAASSA